MTKGRKLIKQIFRIRNNKEVAPVIFPQIKNCVGFTLIETILTIAVFILVIGLVVALVLMSYRTQDYSFQQSQAVVEARRGVETMVKEIREATIAENGAYVIEDAQDFQFIFYSDVDRDQNIERVRYFLESGGAVSDNETKQCVTFDDGGSCSAIFNDFLGGTLELAEVRVSIEGDFSAGSERADIYADGQYLGRLCSSGCHDCAGAWEGSAVFDVTAQAQDGSVQFTADSSWQVNDVCDWQEQNHAMKARFEFSWEETQLSGGEGAVFKKGIIDPTGWPAEYPLDQESVVILSKYVRNAPSIFTYYDDEGNEIIEFPARKKDTKLMKVYLVINVDATRAPEDFILESKAQVRNLKTNL